MFWQGKKVPHQKLNLKKINCGEYFLAMDYISSLEQTFGEENEISSLNICFREEKMFPRIKLCLKIINYVKHFLAKKINFLSKRMFWRGKSISSPNVMSKNN